MVDWTTVENLSSMYRVRTEVLPTFEAPSRMILPLISLTAAILEEYQALINCLLGFIEEIKKNYLVFPIFSEILHFIQK